ncbi:MAG: ribonuclease D, partial [Planctomycetota bacterium]
FLVTSMACICRQNEIAPSIVGNAEQVRDLIAYELEGKPKGDHATPQLLKGWRGQVIGKSFRKLLDGEIAIRVADVQAEQPLEFVSVQ